MSRLAHGKWDVRRSLALEGVWRNVHTRGSTEIGERRLGAGGRGAATRESMDAGGLNGRLRDGGWSGVREGIRMRARDD